VKSRRANGRRAPDITKLKFFGGEFWRRTTLNRPSGKSLRISLRTDGAYDFFLFDSTDAWSSSQKFQELDALTGQALIIAFHKDQL